MRDRSGEDPDGVDPELQAFASLDRLYEEAHPGEIAAEPERGRNLGGRLIAVLVIAVTLVIGALLIWGAVNFMVLPRMGACGVCVRRPAPRGATAGEPDRTGRSRSRRPPARGPGGRSARARATASSLGLFARLRHM